MDLQSMRQLVARHNLQSGRAVLAALLCAFGAAALALAILVGSALAAGNLLANGSFERDSDGDGEPNGWVRSDFGGILPKRVCNQAYVGSCSFKYIYDGLNKSTQQVISPLAGNSSETYTLTIWVKGKEIDLGAVSPRVGLYFHQVDGGSDSNYVLLAAGTTAWTKLTVSTTSTEAFDYVYVVISAVADGGKAWFDKVKLVGP